MAPTLFEFKLIDKLIEKTKANQVDWQALGSSDQFMAAFGGKYTAILEDKLGEDGFRKSLTIRNAHGDKMADFTAVEAPLIYDLYALVKQSVKTYIDNQLADLLKEIDLLS